MDRIKDHKERLAKIPDIAILVHRLLGPCEYNPAAFEADQLATGSLRFWYDEKPRPTLEQLETENEKYHKELEAVRYAEERRQQYPTWEQVMEAIVENMEGRPEKLQQVTAKRAEVRAKWPKPRA